jgi:hypothetical protein
MILAAVEVRPEKGELTLDRIGRSADAGRQECFLFPRAFSLVWLNHLLMGSARDLVLAGRRARIGMKMVSIRRQSSLLQTLEMTRP